MLSESDDDNLDVDDVNNESELVFVQVSRNGAPTYSIIVSVLANENPKGPIRTLFVFEAPIAVGIRDANLWIDESYKSAQSRKVLFSDHHSVFVVTAKVEDYDNRIASIAYSPQFVTLPAQKSGLAEDEIFRAMIHLSPLEGILGDGK